MFCYSIQKMLIKVTLLLQRHNSSIFFLPILSLFQEDRTRNNNQSFNNEDVGDISYTVYSIIYILNQCNLKHYTKLVFI